LPLSPFPANFPYMQLATGIHISVQQSIWFGSID